MVTRSSRAKRSHPTAQRAVLAKQTRTLCVRVLRITTATQLSFFRFFGGPARLAEKHFLSSRDYPIPISRNVFNLRDKHFLLFQLSEKTPRKLLDFLAIFQLGTNL